MSGLALRLKIFTASQLCHPAIGALAGTLFHDRIPNRGCVIDVADSVVPPSAKASLFWRFYESAEIRFVRRYLPPDADVVELGASLGAVSAQIAKRLNPGRRLICVEGNAALLPLLDRNIRRNSRGAAHHVVNGAVDYSTAQELVPFRIDEQLIFSRLAGAADPADCPLVPRVTLASLLAEHGVGEYTLVSDIEGAEAGIIEADAGALANCRLVIAELHDCRFLGRRFKIEDLVGAMQHRGFRVVDRHGAVCVLAPVAHRGGT